MLAALLAKPRVGKVRARRLREDARSRRTADVFVLTLMMRRLWQQPQHSHTGAVVTLTTPPDITTAPRRCSPGAAAARPSMAKTYCDIQAGTS